jgi:hypothetical protein
VPIGRTQPGPPAAAGFTCENLSPDTLGIKFDIAPPDKPEAFLTYITAKAASVKAK